MSFTVPLDSKRNFRASLSVNIKSPFSSTAIPWMRWQLLDLFETKTVSALVERSMRSNPPSSLESATRRFPVATEIPNGKAESLRRISEMTLPFKTAPLLVIETWSTRCVCKSEINNRSVPKPQTARGVESGVERAVFSGREENLVQSTLFSRCAFVIHSFRRATISFFWRPAVGICLSSRAGLNSETFILLGLRNTEELSGRYATLLLPMSAT